MARDFERQVAEVQVRTPLGTAAPPLVFLSQKPWDKSVRGKGNLGCYKLCATEPHLIEAKATNGWERQPVHISRNELAVADERRQEWCLFRVWNIAGTSKTFELRPPLAAYGDQFSGKLSLSHVDEIRPGRGASMEREKKEFPPLSCKFLLRMGSLRPISRPGPARHSGL